jgi:hypothetical protein
MPQITAELRIKASLCSAKICGIRGKFFLPLNPQITAELRIKASLFSAKICGIRGKFFFL